MSETVQRIRSIGLIGHTGAGKTSVAEAMLFISGVTSRLGRVDEENSVLDFEPEEIKRHVTISSSFHQCPWKKHDIAFIDTPGDTNFIMDTKACLQVADGALVVVDAVDGVKVETERTWDFANESQLPRIAFINKMDSERADFIKVLEEMRNTLDPKSVPLQVPIGVGDSFKGVIDLVEQKGYFYEKGGGKSKQGDIPDDMKNMVAEQHEVLIEAIAEADDSLLEQYLEDEELTPEQLHQGLRKGVLAGSFIPVLCGSALANIGIDCLMDVINACLPSPLDRGAKVGQDPQTGDELERVPDPEAPFSALIFKTVADPYAGRLSIFRIYSGRLDSDGIFYNASKKVKERYTQLYRIAGKDQTPIAEAGPGHIVAVAKLKETVTGNTICSESAPIIFEVVQPLPPLISYAIQPKSKGDEEKIFGGLAKLLEEDMALKITRNDQTKEIILSGMGEVHIDATVAKLRHKYNVDVILKTPKVPYLTTITKKVRIQGRHKKQTGGHGQYGDCWIEMEPLPRGGGFEFVSQIVGGVIPKQYIPAVEKGILEAKEKGPLSGYPCVDFRVKLVDGSYHSVDSSEMAFKIAGALAFRKGVVEADPVLLEPIMEVAITVPEESMGDIIGDLNSRRGRVLGMNSKGKNQIISVHVPMAEFLSYAPDLRSMTGGRGVFTMTLSHYEVVPSQIAQKVVEAANKEGG
jgi:elongation factor G